MNESGMTYWERERNKERGGMTYYKSCGLLPFGLSAKVAPEAGKCDSGTNLRGGKCISSFDPSSVCDTDRGMMWNPAHQKCVVSSAVCDDVAGMMWDNMRGICVLLPGVICGEGTKWTGTTCVIK